MATVFDCPFCGASESCSCIMDIDHSLGTIRCDSCGAKYDTRISRLSDPIDVYAEWIDKSAPNPDRLLRPPLTEPGDCPDG